MLANYGDTIVLHNKEGTQHTNTFIAFTLAAGKMGPSPVKDDYIDKITLAESLQKRYCFETTS